MPDLYSQICEKIKILIREEDGQGLVEYALILVLIALVAIAAISAVGNSTSSVFTTINSSISP